MPASTADAQALLTALQQGDTAGAQAAAQRIGPTVSALVRQDPARVLNLFRDKSTPAPPPGGLLRQFGAGAMPGVVQSADPATTGQHIARGAGTLAPFIPAIWAGGATAKASLPLLGRLLAGPGAAPLRALLAGGIGGTVGELVRGAVPGDQGVTPGTVGTSGAIGGLAGGLGGLLRGLRTPRAAAAPLAVQGASAVGGGATTTPTTGLGGAAAPAALGPSPGVPTAPAPTPPVAASPALQQVQAGVQEAVEQSQGLQSIFNYQPQEAQGVVAGQQRVAETLGKAITPAARKPITATQINAATAVDPRLGKLLQMQETLENLQRMPGGGGATAQQVERQIAALQRSMGQRRVGQANAYPNITALRRQRPAQKKAPRVPLPVQPSSGSGILPPIGTPPPRSVGQRGVDATDARIRAKRLGEFRRGKRETP